jgi:hypothetical protein
MKNIKTNKQGKQYKVIGSAGEYSKIEFIESGHRCRVKKSLCEKGLAFDPSDIMKNDSEWEVCDEWMTNNAGDSFVVFRKKGQLAKVYFPETGYVRDVYYANAIKGKVKDTYKKSLYGNGALGEFDKSISYWRQAKQLWSNMVKRCYDPNYDHGYFGTAEVSERWKTFETFLNEIHEIEGFEGWLSGHIEGNLKYNLDKDFIMKGNRLYSKNLCLFLPESYNKSLGKLGKTVLATE